MKDDPGLQNIAWSGLFVIEVTRGRIAAGMRALARGRSVGASKDASVLVLLDSIRASEIDELLLGRSARAVERLDASLARISLGSIATIDRPYFRVAAAYGKSRRSDRARAMLSQFDSHVRDTLVRRRPEHNRRWALGEIALDEAGRWQRCCCFARPI